MKKFSMKRVLNLNYIVALLLGIILQDISFGQTPVGFTNSAPLSNFELTSQEAFDLFEEWQSILSPNLDDLPSARETEIYQELVRGEQKDDVITFVVEDDRWGAANNMYRNILRMEINKDLAWLVNTLHQGDKVLALRNPSNDICWVTGEASKTWIHSGGSGPNGINSYGGDGIIPPLTIGNSARPLVRFSKWILDNPELFTVAAPTNSAIPLTIPGTTCYDRAKFYLEEVKATYEICISAGMNWEYDEGYAWVWEGSTNDSSKILNAQATYPNGIPYQDLRFVCNADGFPPHAYNRVFAYLNGYQQCAEGLQRIDILEGTTIHSNFCATAFGFVEKCLNSFRDWRGPVTEEEPIGFSYIFPYRPGHGLGSFEDSTHFEMDIAYLEGLRHLLTPTDRLGLTGTIFSRHYDSETHVFFSKINRAYSYDGITGDIVSGYDWWQSPGMLSWIGENGTDGQMQGAVALSLEVFDEQMRKMAIDSSFKDALLNRDDIRRTRTVKGPFEIYDFKLERAARGLTPTPGGNNPPVFTSAPSFGMSTSYPLGAEVGSVMATDPDAGQTLRYWILGGNVDNRYKIDSNTGIIRLNNLLPLDLSANPDTSLEIAVMDDGIPMQMTTVIVEIHSGHYPNSNSTPATYDLTYLAGPNGTLTGDVSQIIISGNAGMSITAVPTATYQFVSWSDGSTANPRTDLNVTSDINVTANFGVETFDLIYAPGEHGMLTGTTSQLVDYNANGTAVTVIPDSGYLFSHWSDWKSDNPRIDSSVVADVSATAQFSIVNENLLVNGSFESEASNFNLTGNTGYIPLSSSMVGQWISRQGTEDHQMELANISGELSDQDGRISMMFQANGKRGLVQLINVSQVNISGLDLTFSAAFAAPGREALSSLDMATYQVIGFNDFSGLTVELSNKYEFQGGTYDDVVAQRVIADNELSGSMYTTFNEQVTLNSDYNYLAVLIGGDAGVANSDTQYVAVEEAQLYIAILDADADGMPDSWEMAYGLNTSTNDASEDVDGDGLTNYEEFRAGTNPTNGASVLTVDYPALWSASNMTVSWQSVSGKVYSIYGSTNLLSPGWMPLQTNLQATAPLNTATVNVGNVESGFYKIQVK